MNLNSTNPALVSKTLFPNNNNNHGMGSGTCVWVGVDYPTPEEESSMLPCLRPLFRGLAGFASFMLSIKPSCLSVSDLEAGSDDLGFSKWIEEIQATKVCGFFKFNGEGHGRGRLSEDQLMEEKVYHNLWGNCKPTKWPDVRYVI
ncbi:unnamed protein product [Camellia sinensis]